MNKIYFIKILKDLIKTMKPINLSAFLVVRNEEKNLDRCLKSLKFCDEIIIVDQQSTDNTIKIAKKYWEDGG